MFPAHLLDVLIILLLVKQQQINSYDQVIWNYSTYIQMHCVLLFAF
jgi:hypothetical protein